MGDAGTTPERQWRVKYDGVCARCGTPLLRGTPAVWDRTTRAIQCIECPSSIPAAMPTPVDSGVAGASAQREFERRKAKRDARIDERFGRLAGVVRALTIEPETTRAWATGAVGEQRIGAVLASVPGVKVLHDRRVPGARGNIDHIVIGQGGVFVVDAKKLAGMVEIRDRGWLLRPDYRLTVGRRDRSSLARNMTWQAEAVAAALGRVTAGPLPRITPVLCFVGASWPLISPPNEYEGVRLEGERSIKRLLERAGELDSEEIDRITRLLAGAFPSK
jgi:hypothetical protein